MKKLCLFVLLFVSSYSFCQDTPWVTYNSKNSKLPSDNIHSVAIDSFGVKWITAEKGLVKIDGNNWTLYDKSNSAVTCTHPGKITIEGKDTLWIATYCAGLLRFDGTNWKVYNSTNSPLPADKWVTAVAIDNEGNKWVGTATGGAAKFDGKDWTVYNTSNSKIPSNHINCVAYHSMMGLTVFGTDSGVAMFDGTNWTINNKDNSPLPGNDVQTITIDKKGILWVGTKGQGFVAHAGTTCDIYNTFNSELKSNFISTIFIDLKNQKWIGTETGGLHKFLSPSWSVFDTSNSDIVSDSISTIAVDTNGTVWVGTSNKGLSVFKDIPAGIDDDDLPVGTVHAYSLSQNYPNPFNPTTRINYSIPKEEFVTLKIYDLLGSEVASMVSELKKAGSHSVEFNASKLPSGVYIYTIRAGQFRDSRKLLLLK
ncbi:MAG: T9SS type A sorting domain-containing protein [Ignavibacteria bacterium]|jgi:ligand-binding sensor domain-containing protein|nr:T9SS type A sorting domain-containing protein [Ignavibacteria bacterium]MCU7504592.1 T9SS type A sorting domain-containing protein [Ignavibacteria bacterium]MCU7516570.1 T9SS type A sorting domain-containing protein [Ignavibacteria bacterium]